MKRLLLGPALAFALALALPGAAGGHSLDNHCHVHLFQGGGEPAHADPIPGCIEPGGSVYVPSECYVPRPSAECRALIERQRTSMRKSGPHKALPANEPGKIRVARLWD